MLKKQTTSQFAEKQSADLFQTLLSQPFVPADVTVAIEKTEIVVTLSKTQKRKRNFKTRLVKKKGQEGIAEPARKVSVRIGTERWVLCGICKRLTCALSYKLS